eukprot:TRINITY_DN505_c0_g3_i1.p2 TRINITY_DN505_c0_g3~~TRINITY_DN505_c0_g3_i1.p2  ORF type:complete len:187 (-),score=62.34 TRINITY_DN505_c0_g3_i1:156-716(-)
MNFFQNLGESNAFIKGLSDKIGLKPGFVSLILCGILFIFLYQGITTGFVVFFFGILMPGYDSFKAIESPQKDDDTRLLNYWCAFSIVLMMDGFLQPSVSFGLLSGILRLAIIGFLLFDDYKGSTMVYTYFIGPLMRAYRNDIDTTYRNMKQSLASLGNSIKQGIGSGTKGDTEREIPTDGQKEKNE